MKTYVGSVGAYSTLLGVECIISLLGTLETNHPWLPSKLSWSHVVWLRLDARTKRKSTKVAILLSCPRSSRMRDLDVELEQQEARCLRHLERENKCCETAEKLQGQDGDLVRWKGVLDEGVEKSSCSELLVLQDDPEVCLLELEDI
jgi:hypothetical protein